MCRPMPPSNRTPAILVRLCELFPRFCTAPADADDRGMAPVAHVLFNKIMTYNPKNSSWVNRDRFVLS
jgi:hypothetical protein